MGWLEDKVCLIDSSFFCCILSCKLVYEVISLFYNRDFLQRTDKDFTVMKVLPSGVYHYRFIVDGQWRYAPDLPCEGDDTGNVFNVLDLQVIFCEPF